MLETEWGGAYFHWGDVGHGVSCVLMEGNFAPIVGLGAIFLLVQIVFGRVPRGAC